MSKLELKEYTKLKAKENPNELVKDYFTYCIKLDKYNKQINLCTKKIEYYNTVISTDPKLQDFISWEKKKAVDFGKSLRDSIENLQKLTQNPDSLAVIFNQANNCGNNYTESNYTIKKNPPPTLLQKQHEIINCKNSLQKQLNAYEYELNKLISSYHDLQQKLFIFISYGNFFDKDTIKGFISVNTNSMIEVIGQNETPYNFLLKNLDNFIRSFFADNNPINFENTNFLYCLNKNKCKYDYIPQKFISDKVNDYVKNLYLLLNGYIKDVCVNLYVPIDIINVLEYIILGDNKCDFIHSNSDDVDLPLTGDSENIQQIALD